LDGARGGLALVVVVNHVAQAFGCNIFAGAAYGAVLIFFTMSGFVLARAYDGRPAAFCVRRVVRLWPLYAVCVMVGYAAVGTRPGVAELLWYPLAGFNESPHIDLPAWSLYFEAWATPFLPILFAIAQRNRTAGLLSPLLVICLSHYDVRLYYGVFFAAGIAASHFAARLPERIPQPVIWLGKVSFSLYLTHALVFKAAFAAGGPWVVAGSVPAAMAIAWLAYETVERPAIWASRAAGRQTTRLAAALTGLLAKWQTA
jgi:peptidoglycan/LPS O-acetylase OafA/YrhL